MLAKRPILVSFFDFWRGGTRSRTISLEVLAKCSLFLSWTFVTRRRAHQLAQVDFRYAPWQKQARPPRVVFARGRIANQFALIDQPDVE